MPTDLNSAKEIKRKITEIIKLRGPSLPVHVASQIGISMMFAGAFLSELAQESIIKISEMKVGGSPLYFLHGQEVLLERFHTFLPGKEKEAFLLLKSKGILKDREQEPAIRVALRNLKDFAKSFSNDEELWWRFHSVTEQQVREIFEKLQEAKRVKEKKAEEIEIKVRKPIKRLEKPEKSEKAEEPAERQLDLGLKKGEEKKEKPKKRKPSYFLEQVISFLTTHKRELVNIEKSTKKEVFIKVKENEKIYLLYAINKRKISESDLIKAHKKASEMNLPYHILTKGEPSKKLKEAILACKTLEKIDKLE